MSALVSFSFVGMILILIILLLVEVSKQSKASGSSRYVRVPVIPPKRTSAVQSATSIFTSVPMASTQSSQSSSQRQHQQQHQRQRVNALQPKLLTLLNGDRATAQRLLHHAKQMNPGRNEDWYFEKVIYDLSRDRH